MKTEMIPCMTRCCWGNDSGMLYANGFYSCSHCGEQYQPQQFIEALTESIAEHDAETARLLKLRDTIKEIVSAAVDRPAPTQERP